MNILITGANGQLGNEMRLISKSSPNEFIFSDVTQNDGSETVSLDITKIDDIRALVAKESVDVIVNCAAYTNVDKAEEEPEIAEILNTKAPENLAIVMKETNGLLVHISTDYVFGGTQYNTPCTEDLEGNPTGAYGATKLQGEKKIIESGCKYVIIRTAWLYSEFGKNFLKTMLNLTSAKEEISVVFDQVGTPTYALDLAQAIAEILQDYSKQNQGQTYSNTGIYHFSNEGVCSWYDFAKNIAEIVCRTNCKVMPCHSSEFPSKVVRPSYSVLDKTKIKETFGIEIPYWVDSLKKCIAKMMLSE
ncbi:MAG: dTDP-4-dehydrorhamnose reductase [Rikenellaceae bacterium]|nr:dTDP-4-dehydrorhamnose reductase [Rikenellaceae bacterium]